MKLPLFYGEMGKRHRRKLGWAGQWDRHVWDMPGVRAHRRRKHLAEARIALWCGLLLGLLGFNAAQFLPAQTAVEASAPVVDATWGGIGSSVRVVDGDTFDYAGERIRIADIDTPELRSRCVEEGRLARAATARLKSLLAAGPFELKRLGRDEDRYGRKLRVVVRGGRSLGDVLVAEGLARTWTGRREPWC
jgi:endonuclease YncB( thermonuclease family)